MVGELMRIILAVPTALRVRDGEESVPMAGAEYSAGQLRDLLRGLGHDVECQFSTTIEETADLLRKYRRAEVTLVSRVYVRRSRLPPELQGRRKTVLWIHDLVSDVVGLSGLRGLDLLSLLLTYDHIVFVSEWQRLSFLKAL